MKFLHTMVRIRDVEESLNFYVDTLGLKELRRKDVPAGKFTNIFLSTAEGEAEIELTYNWESDEVYETGRSWGHLAFEVEDIYEYCEMLMEKGVTINRPPRDGWMAFIKSPDGVSIELLQKGERKEIIAPWKDMENIGTW